jgi:hypothetical protein
MKLEKFLVMRSAITIPSLLILLACWPSLSSAATFEITDDGEPWCVLRLDSERDLQIISLEGTGKFDDAVFVQIADDLGIYHSDASALELSVDGQTRAFEGQADEFSGSAIFEVPASLVSELAHAKYWTYHYGKHGHIEVHEPVTVDQARQFLDCMTGA